MKPIILTEEQLPTEVDAAMVQWSLGRLIRKVPHDRTAWIGARTWYEMQADRRAR